MKSAMEGLKVFNNGHASSSTCYLSVYCLLILAAPESSNQKLPQSKWAFPTEQEEHIILYGSYVITVDLFYFQGEEVWRNSNIWIESIKLGVFFIKIPFCHKRGGWRARTLLFTKSATITISADGVFVANMHRQRSKRVCRTIYEKQQRDPSLCEEYSNESDTERHNSQY